MPTNPEEAPNTAKHRYFHYLVFGLLVFALIFLANHGRMQVVTQRQLDKLVTDSGGSEFPLQQYYCGSDYTYDYYALSFDGRYFDRYRVIRNQNSQANRVSWTSLKSRWRNLSALGVWKLATAAAPWNTPATIHVLPYTPGSPTTTRVK